MLNIIISNKKINFLLFYNFFKITLINNWKDRLFVWMTMNSNLIQITPSIGCKNNDIFVEKYPIHIYIQIAITPRTQNLFEL